MASVETEVHGYLRHLAIERGRSANTVVAYRRDLARYASYLDGTELARVTRDHVSGFLASLLEGEAPELAPVGEWIASALRRSPKDRANLATLRKGLQALSGALEKRSWPLEPRA